MTWIFIIASILGFNILPATSAVHDIHLSKCQIKYSQKSESLQITLHLFLDDLELALGDAERNHLKLFSDKEHANADSLILDYLNEHIRLEVEGQMLVYDYLGKEISDDLIGMWCYMEIYDVSNVDQLEIKYNVFQELYNDQINILTLSNRSGDRSYLTFTEPDQKENWTL